jgi:4-amino-4-deoxy-L-arabinose transferase-like glycosyltransferase
MSDRPRTTAWISAALFVAALFPRIWAPIDFLTVDEAYHWFDRIRLFHAAIRSGEYAGTLQIGHPGVTTMWLGSLGFEIYSQLRQLGWQGSLALEHQLIRLPLAAAAALSIAIAFVLLVRLVDRRVALLGALLWAAEPFLIAHAQLLHVDSLLASFSTLAILMALVALRNGDAARPPVDYRWLIGSAICFGLAMLTKSPAVMVAPTVGWVVLHAWRAKRMPIRAAMVALGVWGATAVLVWVALWPAVWVIPATAVYSVVNEAFQNGSTPHGWGNYFAGQAVENPGPSFYLVALALRLAPWTLAGAVVGLVALRAAPQRDRTGTLGALALFSLTFLILMTLLAKKFDRYALPAIPALTIIAASGLLWLWDLAALRISALRSMSGAARTLGWGAVAAGLALHAGGAMPYPLAYYSPLFGGGPAAARMLPIGWGEGLEQAGAYIRAQPDGCDRPVAVFYGPVLRPFVCNRVVSLSMLNVSDEAGYAVLYIDQIQRGIYPDETQWLLADPPLHTIRINGIDYAYIYQLKQPVATAADVVFGSAIRLVGYESTPALTAGQVVTFTLEWQKLAAEEADYMLFVHLFDADGRRVGQSDLVLGGAENPASRWSPQRFQLQEVTVALSDPSATVAWAALGLYDPATTLRAPVSAPPPPAGAPDVGGNALVLRLGDQPR